MDVDLPFRDLGRGRGDAVLSAPVASVAAHPHLVLEPGPAPRLETEFASGGAPSASGRPALRIDWIRVAAVAGCIAFWSLLLHVL